MRPDDGCAADDGRLQVLHGWGRTAPTAARTIDVGDASMVGRALRHAGRRGVLARGLGRSYGDAAQNAGGVVLAASGLDRILAVDSVTCRARVGAGVSLDRLMRAVVPLGLWPVVTPGTRQVTIGGAVAADVHGKNHHRDGSFARHVDSVLLATPALGTVEVGPDRDPELFWATAGGMGLTGVVLEATIRLLPVETATMRVDTERIEDLDHLMARMAETDPLHRYSVAWVDSLARGRRLGRSVLELGDHARRDELPSGSRSEATALRFAPSDRLAAPQHVPPGLLNRASIAVFNEVWFRKAPRRRHGHLVGAASFFHPLDAVRDWNRLYGPRGFVQYQLAVPDGAEEVLRRCLEAFGEARCGSFLTVLKRFGPGTPGPLSFPQPGWTLALDIPSAAAGLRPLLDRIDELVACAGGRVYLAKDSRLTPGLLETMYPDLPRWRAARDRADPTRRMSSDMARRLPLLESLHDGVPAAVAAR